MTPTITSKIRSHRAEDNSIGMSDAPQARQKGLLLPQPIPKRINRNRHHGYSHNPQDN